jgi:hypothetical protein
MAIANGNPVLAADLNALGGASRVAMQAVMQRLPGALYIDALFSRLTDTSAEATRRMKFVVPADIYVESLCVQTTAANSTASTIAVNVTGDGVLPPWAFQISDTLGTGATKKHARLLYDNGGTANPGVTPELTGRALRLLPKGSTVTLSVSTTNTLATMEAYIVLVCRQYRAREYA